MGNIKYNEPTSFEEMEDQVVDATVPPTDAPEPVKPVETNETTE
jgi:hypothetical protein